MQAENPALHAKPHWPAAHVAVPLGGAVQGVHEPPHELTDALSAHEGPQAWKPVLQLVAHAPATQARVP